MLLLKCRKPRGMTVTSKRYFLGNPGQTPAITLHRTSARTHTNCIELGDYGCAARTLPAVSFAARLQRAAISTPGKYHQKQRSRGGPDTQWLPPEPAPRTVLRPANNRRQAEQHGFRVARSEDALSFSPQRARIHFQSRSRGLAGQKCRAESIRCSPGATRQARLYRGPYRSRLVALARFSLSGGKTSLAAQGSRSQERRH
jgi:hypothetical protein